MELLLFFAQTDKESFKNIQNITWGFGDFLECMSGFGTGVAIGASMLASIGINPILAILVCLLSNAMHSSYASSFRHIPLFSSYLFG